MTPGNPGSAALLALAVLAAAGPAAAGSFAVAQEGAEDRVAHPTGYTGSGGALSVSVCIDPGSAHAAAMVVPVQNAIDVWNGLAPSTGNLQSANVPPLHYDFESVALHEIGHCLGLGHPNLGNLPGLGPSQTDFTQSSNGPDDAFDLGAGSDGIEGSSDDARDDDGNLHYFRIADNDPFALGGPVDASTYSRDPADLPSSDDYAANCDRQVAADQGLADTECVMQQGTPHGEARRSLGHDDVATLRYAMSGLDRSQGSADDYSVELVYAGLSSSCDIVLDFDDTQTSFALCTFNAQFVDSPPSEHLAITSAHIYFNTGSQPGNLFDWFFNPVRSAVPVPALGPLWLGGAALLLAGGARRLLRRR